MARRTLSTSAPNSSQTVAISFMNDTRVASIAFEAYLHSSALAQSMSLNRRAGARERRVQGLHQSRRALVLGPDHDAIGRMKSSIAAPCFRNSGLLTTLNGWLVSSAITSRRPAAVPTGTVLFVTTTV